MDNPSRTHQNGHGSPPAARTRPEPVSAHRLPRPRRKRRSFLWLFVLLFCLALGIAVAIVLVRKFTAQQALESSTQKMAVPTVLTIQPKLGNSHIHLDLPGTVNAFMQSSVYAQVSGYIKAWHVDIGGAVVAGQLLAEIETPVTDQSLLQAGESVKQAEANLNLAKVTAARYNALLVTHAVAQQDVDSQNANVRVQEAALSGAKAFESGIQKTEAFKQVRAPFDGVVTARQVDVGDYVSATGQTNSSNIGGSGPAQTGTPNQELFRVAQTKTLRVYVNVPEQNAHDTVPGTKAIVEFASAPNRPVTGTLVRTSDAIDPSSLTLLAEVDVENPIGKLLPGGYAQVRFALETERPPLVIPGNSLIFRQQGPQVGIVDGSDVVHLRSIKIARDLGSTLEIAEGLNQDDRVIVNPSDSLADGQKVRVQPNSSENKPQP